MKYNVQDDEIIVKIRRVAVLPSPTSMYETNELQWPEIFDKLECTDHGLHYPPKEVILHHLLSSVSRTKVIDETV